MTNEPNQIDTASKEDLVGWYVLPCPEIMHRFGTCSQSSMEVSCFFWILWCFELFATTWCSLMVLLHYLVWCLFSALQLISLYGLWLIWLFSVVCVVSIYMIILLRS